MGGGGSRGIRGNSGAISRRQQSIRGLTANEREGRS